MKSVLWYDSPAEFNKWEEQSLVIGNGFLGASFFGGTETEKIVFNEKTLWNGGPSSKRNYNGGNVENSFTYTETVRKLLASGKYSEASELLPMLTSESENGFGAYQCLCEVYLDFTDIARIENYRRQLDMECGALTTTFTSNGTCHKRTAFANYPDNVICIQLSADRKGGVSFKLRLGGIQEGGSVSTTEGVMRYSGSLVDNGLRYAAVLKAENHGGSVDFTDDSIIVSGSDVVNIYFSAATDYAPEYPKYRSRIAPMQSATEKVHSAIRKGFQVLSNGHIDDFSRLFKRVEINLGAGEPPEIPTDKLLEEYKKTSDSTLHSPHFIEELFFQFGRYCLISSSRAGTLPANLQGCWNETNNPPWCCDYHTNINLQMNYWGAYNTNLVETVPPLIDFVDSMREPGRVTARECHGCNGFVFHTQTNPFGWTAPGWDFYWGWSVAAVAWLMQNLWEYYEFTLDYEYLERKIFPIMREAVIFYKEWLVYDEKQERLVSSPSYSPEHGPVTVGNTYEQCLIEQFYSDFIKACEILDVDIDLCEEIRKQRELLKPYKIGENGNLLEWFEVEMKEEARFDDSKVEKHHRHISHLLGLYPGNSITKNTPELLQAAVKVMEERGFGGTGWSQAFKACLWARCGDAIKGGEKAHRSLFGLISERVHPNMFSFHPPFQIDGNLGGTAAIAEMLLQSHEGVIEAFPSIPKAWENAEFSGLCARGGFTVDARLRESKLVKLRIVSKNGGLCRIKLYSGIIEFNTKKGGVYDVL